MDVKLAGGRDLTRMAVLALLGRGGPMSRADVARELDVSPTTITQVVKRMIDQGMVEELEAAPSTGGRPGKLIGVVGTAGRALGVKVAADHLAVVDVRLDGTVLASYTTAFDARGADAPDRLAAMLRPYVETESDVPLLGLGVGVPGVVDSLDSGCVTAQVLGWERVPIGRLLRGAYGVPVLVENDVKAVAVAEQLYGRGRRLQNFLVVTIGRGVGLAIVADGSVYRGSRGGAGEFGHFPIDPDGPMCACGNRGCLEAHIGMAGLLDAAVEAGVLSAEADIRRLQELADTGDPDALTIYANAGSILARGVAALVTVLDPEKVIILGEGTSAWQHWDGAFRAGLVGHIAGPMRDTPIEVEPWDDSSWAQGAAALVLATPFDMEGMAGHQTEHVLARLAGITG